MPTPKKGYYAEDGREIPSTTKIAGLAAEMAGGLIGWAYNQGYAQRPRFEKDAAAAVGTYVHAQIEACLRDGDIAVPPPQDMSAQNVEEAVSAYAAFRKWLDGSRFQVVAVEQHFISEAHRFGDTPDAIAIEPDGTRSLLDWKTVKYGKEIYPENLMQVAAYRALWNETHPASLIDGGVHIVRFGKGGGDFQHNYFPPAHRKLAAAWRMFVLFREAYDLNRALRGKDD